MPLTAAERQRRSRAHRCGIHELCDPNRCPDAPVPGVTTCDTAPGLAGTLKGGDRKRALEAIRDTLADLIQDERDPRDAALLSRELRALLAEIAGLSGASPGARSGLDELEHRRREREAMTG